MPEHHGFRVVALGDQVLQLGDLRRDIDRLGICARLHIAADIEVVAVAGNFLDRDDAGQLLDIGEGVDGLGQRVDMIDGQEVLRLARLEGRIAVDD